ncbi:MAG: AraC family transcriptional regulator [Provencibacterium sp.]|jgi:AraC-like DNA-binding protein/quercetin dioxygenase-like cupin family protein|nr:AraC family transcriptional regulator [Provencibacterium sp.]
MREALSSPVRPVSPAEEPPFQSELPPSIRDRQLMVGLPEPYRMIHVMERPPAFLLSHHSHRWYHINYLLSGSVDIYFKGQVTAAHEGQAFVLPPQIPHKLVSRGGYAQLGLDLLPVEDERGIWRLVREAFGEEELAVVSIPALPKRFEEIYGIVQGMSTLDTLRLLNLAESMLFELLEVSRVGRDLTFKNRFLEMLQRRGPYSLSLEEMCAEMNLSKTHLERLANRELGCSAVEYCSKLRCSRACLWLQVSDKSIRQIAEELGFYDESHFNAFFKRAMGLPPGRYRRQFRLQNGQVQGLPDQLGGDAQYF